MSVFSRAHAVLQLPTVSARDAGRDERFIAALSGEFPNVVSHQAVPAETPPIVPHLVLASTSSQLALSAIQADFEVRFYGEYATDPERGLEFVERKIRSILAGFDAIGEQPMMIGVVATLDFSFTNREGVSPAEHVLATHLKVQVDREAVQDALARIAFKLRDTYFVTMTVSNYETRTFERPILPGLNAIQIRPWEGRLDDAGVQLAIDINNNLEIRTREQTPVVTDVGLRAVMQVLSEIVMTAGPAFVESGAVAVDELAATSSVS
jgi:hypothetical protein